MDVNDQFTYDIFSGLLAESRKATTVNSKIIKNGAVKLGTPHKIHSRDEVMRTRAHQPQVLPIKKNGEIIGVISECSCGEVVKVYFDYE